MGAVGVGHVAVRLAVLADTLDQVVHLGVEGVVVHGARVGQHRLHCGPAGLAGEELLGPDAVVAQGAFGAGQVDVEGVGHFAVEQGRGFADGAVFELQDGHHVGVELEEPLLVVREGRDLDDLPAGEPADGVHGVASAQEHGASAGFLGVTPVEAGPPAAQAVPVVDLDVKQIAHGPGGQQGLEVLKQRVPAEDEADDALDAGVGYRVPQRPVLVHGQADGLFDHQVLSGPGGGDALLGVDVVGPAEVDDVDAIVGQDAVEIVAHVAVEVELVRQALRALVPAARDGDDSRVRVLNPARGVRIGHVTRPVNGHPQLALVHGRAPVRELRTGQCPKNALRMAELDAGCNPRPQANDAVGGRHTECACYLASEQLWSAGPSLY